MAIYQLLFYFLGFILLNACLHAKGTCSAARHKTVFCSGSPDFLNRADFLAWDDDAYEKILVAACPAANVGFIPKAVDSIKEISFHSLQYSFRRLYLRYKRLII